MTGNALAGIIFYVFATLSLVFSLVVILARHPVYSVLALVATFICSAVLWLLLQAEFLALVLIFLYVGAVMTLFLFVVMMLNPGMMPANEGFSRLLPVAGLLMAALLGFMLMVFMPMYFDLGKTSFVFHDASYQNLTKIAELLFKHYLLSFEAAGVLLVVSIVAAIALAFHGRRAETLAQSRSKQIRVTQADRLRIVQGD